jgi:hypothetical protein
MSGGSKQMGVKDLRAQFGTAGGKPVRAPAEIKAPPPRPKQKDRADELAEKAEKMAMIHHQTSLLSRNPKNDRSKPPKEKKKSGILLQLLIVVLLAGGGAYLLDPSIASNIDLQPVKDWIDVQLQSFD